MKRKLFRQVGLLLMVALAACTGCSKHGGKVLDARSNQPIANAIVVHNGVMTHTDGQGKFLLSKFDEKQPVLVKLPGYRRAKAQPERFTDCTIRLEPFQAKGVYLSFGALKTDTAREAVVALFNGTDLNTLVIDVKNERGFISLDCDAGVGIKVSRAAPPAIDDMEGFLKELHAKHIYVIGRLQTFRDDALGHDRPDLAIANLDDDKPWRDGTAMKWGDPFRPEVQDYNIAVAVTAAAAGFDEIQFANVNVPGGKYKLVKENNSENRNTMRKEFWEKANRALMPYNVYLSAEFWGPTLFNKDATGTQTVLKELAQRVDYISPSVFPADLSGMFPHRKKDAAMFPYHSVAETVKRGGQMVGSTKQFRPWLQNYQSSLLKMVFAEKEIALQMQAAVDTGANGFLMWQAASRYTNTLEALKILADGSAKLEVEKTLAQKEAAPEALTTVPPSAVDPATDTAKAEQNTNNVEVANP